MSLVKSVWSLTFVLGAAVLLGCGGSEMPSDVSDPPIPYAESLPEDTNDSGAGSTGAASASGASIERTFPGITLTIPASWNELPNQGFVDAKYVVPHPAGDMELTLTTMGGGIDANVDRWIGQFQMARGDSPQRETFLIDGVDASWIDVRGTYSSRVSGNPGPHENWGLLGVAIPNQPKDFYIKLTGPREAISDFHDEFREFLQTARIER